MSDSEEATQKRAVQRFWFSGLTPEEQERILRPHFESAHPNHEDKRRVEAEYEDW